MSDLWVPGGAQPGDPWKEAWQKLRDYIKSGATNEDVTAYAKELGLGLPSVDARDSEAMARCFAALADVIRDIETS